MKTLNDHIVENALSARGSQARILRARRPISEDVGGVSVMRSPGLDAASVALPAGIDLDDRAARMNEFWKALVEFQYRDVLVVAICADSES
jgi:hypothetical protein